MAICVYLFQKDQDPPLILPNGGGNLQSKISVNIF